MKTMLSCPHVDEQPVFIVGRDQTPRHGQPIDERNEGWDHLCHIPRFTRLSLDQPRVTPTEARENEGGARSSGRLAVGRDAPHLD